jgi:hypothetical protein
MSSQPDFEELLKELNESIPALHKFLEDIAGRFELDFNKNLFVYTVVSPEQKTLLDFLGGCPTPPHEKWPSDYETRSKNAENFIHSKEFIESVKTLTIGGSVIESSIMETLERLPVEINSPEWVVELRQRFGQHDEKKEENLTVLLFVSTNWNGSLKNLQTLLVHEWLHLLFFKNSVKFQTSFPEKNNTWLYDEGLATWVEGRFATGKWNISDILLNQVKNKIEKEAPISVWGYFAMAHWFNESFKNISEEKWGTHLKSILKNENLINSIDICSEVRKLICN